MEFNIGFSRKQLKMLMTAVEIFGFVTEMAAESEEEEKEIADFYDYILGQLYHNGFKKDIDINEDGSYWVKTDAEDVILGRYMEKYNDQNFWLELIKRLGARDFQKKYGERVREMDEDDYVHHIYEEAEKYEVEFKRNGLSRLRIE